MGFVFSSFSRFNNIKTNKQVVITKTVIPDDYINPDGSIDIIENGTYDVTNFESVNVNIPTTSYTEWSGTVETDYRLLNADDVGKVFGVDLETTAYVYFESDYVDIAYLGTSEIQLTDFITYNYSGDMGGAYISFGLSVSGADNLWVNGTPSFETCTIAEGTKLTTFYANTDWNTWFYVKDKAEPYNITISTTDETVLNTKDKVCTENITIKVDESLLGSGGSENSDVTLDNQVKVNLLSDNDNLQYGQYSIDYGKTWIPITIGSHSMYNYGATIDVEIGVNLLTDSSGGSQKYAVVLIKFSSILNSFTSENSYNSVASINNISSCYALFVKQTTSPANFVLTFSLAGGAD